MSVSILMLLLDGWMLMEIGFFNWIGRLSQMELQSLTKISKTTTRPLIIQSILKYWFWRRELMMTMDGHRKKSYPKELMGGPHTSQQTTLLFLFMMTMTNKKIIR